MGKAARSSSVTEFCRTGQWKVKIIMYSTVGTSAFVLALLLCICQRKGSATLLTTPQDTEVKVNDSAYLRCSTSDSSLEIHWHHNGKHVYAGGKFYSPYYERFQMMNGSIGEYSLLINSVKPEDAGLYECRDKEGSGQPHSAELIVLAAVPACASNMKPDGVVGPNTCNVKPEEVQFSCSVTFYGRPPKMEWSSLGNQTTLSNVSCETNSSQLTCNLTLAADQNLNGSSYACHTTRAKSKQYECTTEALNVIYVNRNFIVTEKALNDKVTCSVNSSLQAYRVTWKLMNGGREFIVANSQTHELNTSGLYRCEIEYSIKSTKCSDVIAFFYVTDPGLIAENGAQNTHTSSVYMELMVAFIVAFVVTNAAWLFYVVRSKLKNKRRRRVREETELLSRERNTTLDELETQLARTNTDCELYKTKIEDLEEKHARQRLDWEEEKKILLQRQLETDQLLFRNRTGKINYLREAELIGVIKNGDNEAEEDDCYNEQVHGLAILDNELFAIKRFATEFLVFSLTDYNYIRTCPVKEMQNPRNLVSCQHNECLYILDWKCAGMPKEILVVDVNGNLMKEEKWLVVGEDCGHMSVTSEFNVILPIPNKMLLHEYAPDGKLLRQIYISVDSDIMNPRHAIKLSSGHFVICHGDVGEVLHRVCVIDTNGNLIKAFGERKGCTDNQLDVPSYLAVDGDENILVVDRYNKRVLLLSPSLQFKKELLHCEKHKLRGPWRVCIDSKQGRLFVADNDSKISKYFAGQILIFSASKMI